MHRFASYCLSAAVLLAVAATAAWASPSDPVNPLTKRFMIGKPLDICDQGAFFVGGVPKVPDFGQPRQIIIGQMYTQFDIPTKRKQWPLIMLHGSGLTGSTLDATPDGRMGWLSQAVQNNYATFVVDQPGRGRSGFDSSVLNKARVTNNASLIPNISEAACDGIWTSPSYFGHIIPPGSNIITGTMIRHGDPGDPDPATPQPGPAHGTYPPLYPIPPADRSIDADIEARIGAIGAAPNPVNNTYLAINACKWHLPSMEVTLPGSICPSCIPQQLGPEYTWAPLAMAKLVERLGGAIVQGHSQGVGVALHMVRVLKERGSLHLLKGLLLIEMDSTLSRYGLTASDFDTVPVLMISGDYRPSGGRLSNSVAAAAINASPTRSVSPAQAIDLDSPEFGGKWLGTTHMMMLGTNNLQVFDFIRDWADKNIPNPIVATSCPSGNGQGNNGQGNNGQQ